MNIDNMDTIKWLRIIKDYQSNFKLLNCDSKSADIYCNICSRILKVYGRTNIDIHLKSQFHEHLYLTKKFPIDPLLSKNNSKLFLTDYHKLEFLFKDFLTSIYGIKNNCNDNNIHVFIKIYEDLINGGLEYLTKMTKLISENATKIQIQEVSNLTKSNNFIENKSLDIKFPKIFKSLSEEIIFIEDDSKLLEKKFDLIKKPFNIINFESPIKETINEKIDNPNHNYKSKIKFTRKRNYLKKYIKKSNYFLKKKIMNSNIIDKIEENKKYRYFDLEKNCEIIMF